MSSLMLYISFRAFLYSFSNQIFSLELGRGSILYNSSLFRAYIVSTLIFHYSHRRVQLASVSSLSTVLCLDRMRLHWREYIGSSFSLTNPRAYSKMSHSRVRVRVVYVHSRDRVHSRSQHLSLSHTHTHTLTHYLTLLMFCETVHRGVTFRSEGLVRSIH